MNASKTVFKYNHKTNLIIEPSPHNFLLTTTNTLIKCLPI